VAGVNAISLKSAACLLADRYRNSLSGVRKDGSRQHNIVTGPPLDGHDAGAT
jgi:hypothetical protein